MSATMMNSFVRFYTVFLLWNAGLPATPAIFTSRSTAWTLYQNRFNPFSSITFLTFDRCNNDQLELLSTAPDGFTVEAGNPQAPFYQQEFQGCNNRIVLGLDRPCTFCPTFIPDCPPGDKTIFLDGFDLVLQLLKQIEGYRDCWLHFDSLLVFRVVICEKPIHLGSLLVLFFPVISYLVHTSQRSKWTDILFIQAIHKAKWGYQLYSRQIRWYFFSWSCRHYRIRERSIHIWWRTLESMPYWRIWSAAMASVRRVTWSLVQL